jgi:tetratricopeptide (TPR) repeat protein
MESFQKYDFFTALMKTSDRLLRCGNDLSQYRKFFIDNNIRYFDPVVFTNQIEQNGSSIGLTAFNPDIASDNKADLSFADYLVSIGNFQNASLEFQRYLYQKPNALDREKIFAALFFSYYQLKQYSEIIKQYKSNPQLSNNSEIAVITGLSYFNNNEPLNALDLFSSLSNSDQKETRYKSCFYQGIIQARFYDWEKALFFFDKIDYQDCDRTKLEEYRKYCREGMLYQEKSPLLAGALAVIPGLGYLYNGYPMSALSAFILNGLLIWGTYECVQMGNIPLGIIAGSTAIVWYSGNIYGSIKQAERENEKFKNILSLKFEIEL